MERLGVLLDGWDAMMKGARRDGKAEAGAEGGPAGQAQGVPPLDNQAVNELVALLDAGRFIEAILIMEELLQSYPREPILYKLLGMAYGEVGDLAGGPRLGGSAAPRSGRFKPVAAAGWCVSGPGSHRQRTTGAAALSG